MGGTIASEITMNDVEPRPYDLGLPASSDCQTQKIGVSTGHWQFTKLTPPPFSPDQAWRVPVSVSRWEKLMRLRTVTKK